MKVDLLVVGGGVAGMAAAARAVELGLEVVVAEKGDTVGGSGALSAGIVWTAPDLETARRAAPEGDPALLRALVEGFDAAIERVRRAGVPVSDRWSGQMGFGVAHHVDIGALLERWRAALGDAVLTRTTARELMVDADGVVRGAVLEQARPLGDDAPALGGRIGGTPEPVPPDGAATTRARSAPPRPPGTADREVGARAVLLATGGFQGDRELVARLIGWGAEEMPLRSNSGSVGDGLRLGRSAGASLSRGLNRFYGHLIPDRLDRFGPDDYLPLTQYHSAHAILVNVRGRRFTDESRGDETSNQAVLREPEGRAVLICDERVRREHAVGAPYPHGQEIDRFAAAAAAGGRLARADTIGELAERVAEWGVDGAELARTLDGVAADASSPLREPPFHALAVAPCITFTFGGLRTDPDGRVLDRDGRSIRNLYAAGADAGGLQGPGYVGGLALGLVFGPRVAEAIARGPLGGSIRMR